MIREEVADRGVARHLVLNARIGVEQVLRGQDPGAPVDGSDPVGGQRRLDGHGASMHEGCTEAPTGARRTLAQGAATGRGSVET